MILYAIFSTIILTVIYASVLSSRCFIDRRRIVMGGFFVTILTLPVAFYAVHSFELMTRFALTILELIMILMLSSVSILWMFFRDPHRNTPPGKNVLIAPADGRVRYVRKLDQNQIPILDKNGRKFRLSQLTGTIFDKQPCYHIGIEMNILDVHINRIPVDGTVTEIVRLPGKYDSLRKMTSAIENARVSMIIDNGFFITAVVQISSRLVRRIVNRCKIGECVVRGDRFGMIRFGSQVDLIFPVLDSMQVLVQTEQRIIAGETIIARY